MRVLIVGCGYVGLALGAKLVRLGHEVSGLGRTALGNPQLKAAGLIPLTADITLPETFPQANLPYDWVVHCVSAGGGAAEYERVYLEGTRNLLSWLSAAPPKRFVYTSSTSVYGQTDGSPVDESSPTRPRNETGRILVRTEELVLTRARELGIAPIVLRAGGIYGPGRAYWLRQFESGEARLDADGGGRILNMIHRDDVAGAVMAAFASARAGVVYNAVDDQPVSQREMFEWLAQRLARPIPARNPTTPVPGAKRAVTSKRVINRKLKHELGYRFEFPTFRQGFEQILRER
jgi:nucleoside-diphosphate-sugar epimerase